MVKMLIRALVARDWHWIRRGFLWPENKYKTGMIRRVQRQYGHQFLIETGTYRGDTPLALWKQLKRIWTVELHEGLYKTAAERLRPYPNITCIHGTGESAIAEIMPKLEGPAIFWLDSHYSGPGTAGQEDEDMPVLREIDAIAQHSRGGGDIVIIDDISSYSAAKGHTPLSVIIQRLEQIDPDWDFFFDYDMLFALPTERGCHSFWRNIVYHWVIR